MNVKEYVKQLNVRSGETHRGVCPICYGTNTFTASNVGGKVRYNCYKSSCSVAGGLHTGMSLDDIKKELAFNGISDEPTTPFVIPDSFVSPYSEVTKALMERHSILNAYTDGRVDLRFDIRLNRLVFIIRNPITKEVEDAVGRAIYSGDKPKWLRYGKRRDAMLYVPPASTSLTISSKNVDVSKTVVLVEDAISACTVSAIIGGIALLGTNLPQSLPLALRGLGIANVFVALDPDAAAKAVDIQRELCYHFNTKVWLIKDDLKYYTKGRLIEEVGGLLDESTSNC